MDLCIVERRDLGEAQKWLMEHMDKYGCKYSAKELNQGLVVEACNPQPIVGYLEISHLENDSKRSHV